MDNNCENNSINNQRKEFKVAFQTLGCKVNRYETDAVAQAFAQKGFEIVNLAIDADVFVINTCTVTAEADRKSRQMIRRARRQNPELIVVAMGCQVEMQNNSSDAHIIVGTKNRLAVIEQVMIKLNQKFNDFPDSYYITTPKTVFKSDESDYQEFGSVISQEETRAYIKIEDGCNSYCSYCIIPYARGPVVSRKAADVVAEAKALAQSGFHEVVLTGIHICSYGLDRGEGIEALFDLLCQLSKISDIHRIRLGSLEPNSLTEEFIAQIATLPKLCPHFHISLQSGSDEILARMNRKYNTEGYRKIIALLRQFFPDLAVTTDVIVGFPAETDAEHQASYAFCREIGFARIHVFPYSIRQGTKAASMEPKVPQAVIEERRNAFMELSGELAVTYAQTLMGQSVAVLIETQDTLGLFSGYTREYIRVHVASDSDLAQGREINAVVNSQKNGELYASFASNPHI